jgi:hypothetical protein
MSTPLSKIREGIIGGDWQLVCDGYNKITNSDLLPPEIPILKQDIKIKAQEPITKKDFYNAIIEMGGSLGKLANYSLDELKEIRDITKAESEIIPDTSPHEQIVSIKLSNGPLYVSKPEKLLHMDKHVPVRVVADATLDKIVEPEITNRVKRPSPKKVNARCAKCGRKFNALAAFTFSENGETTGICDECKESK